MADKKYRLKTELQNYFDYQLQLRVEPLDYWKNRNIDISALKECSNVYVEYGHAKIMESGMKTSSLCGHDGNDEKSEFRFTIIANQSWEDYNKLNTPESISKLMDAIEDAISNTVNQIAITK